MRQSQSKDLNKYLKYGVLLAMMSFMTFMLMRYLNLDRVLAARVLYWGLFLSISVISFILGRKEEILAVRILIYYNASFNFVLLFIFYLLNAVNDFGVQNEIPIICFSLSLLICVFTYGFIQLKSLVLRLTRKY